jgi:ArsR family transcriptional regulator, virulence genes transcriptional regulator
MRLDIPLDIIRANSAAMADRLKMLSHPERLLMLCRMADEEVTVNQLVELTGMSQSAVSQHLARFRDSGVVVVRPVGQARHYRLDDATIRDVIHALCDICERNAEADIKPN